MPKSVSLRWVAWSGAAFGVMLIIVGSISTRAQGSNYVDVLADQAWRLEVGMWVGAGIGIGFPAVIWLLQAACQGLRHSRGEPREDAEPEASADRGGR